MTLVSIIIALFKVIKIKVRCPMSMSDQYGMTLVDVLLTDRTGIDLFLIWAKYKYLNAL